ncbi:Coronin-like protein crn1, partial [Ceratobasidium sp. 423]
HVFGQSAKKEWCIENVKVSNSAWDTNLISASGEYVAINWNSSGGGAFAILPLASPFRPLPHNLPYKVPDIIPLARGHSAPVLDTDWSPFNDSIVASGGEDGRVLIWKVEASQFEGWGAEKWQPRDFDPVATITGSGRKVGQVLFHPTAENVLASTTVGDGTVRLWDLADSNDAKIALTGHTDTIQSLTWNPTGTLLATTCRDRKIRLFDPRAGSEAVRIGDGHAGIKGARIVWMGGHDRIATTGFSKMSERQLAVWDTSSLANIKTVSIDQSSGVIMPFWSDNNILFLAGKGDGNVRSYEYESDNLYELSEHKSTDPQRGMCFLPRRALSVSDCEIMRAYKVHGSTIEPIGFVVPRKSDQFQSDIFPPAPSSEAALTAGEWFSGKTAPPNLVNLDTGADLITNTPLSGPLPGNNTEASNRHRQRATVTPQATGTSTTSLNPFLHPAERVSPQATGASNYFTPQPTGTTSPQPTGSPVPTPAPIESQKTGPHTPNPSSSQAQSYAPPPGPPPSASGALSSPPSQTIYSPPAGPPPQQSAYAPPPGPPPQPRAPSPTPTVNVEPPPPYTPAADVRHGEVPLETGPRRAYAPEWHPDGQTWRNERVAGPPANANTNSPTPPPTRTESQWDSLAPSWTRPSASSPNLVAGGSSSWSSYPGLGRQGSMTRPPPRHPAQPAQSSLARANTTAGTSSSSRVGPGPPTTTPTPGRALLNNGKVLAYPANYECNRCHLTGYVAYDPSNPCRECWSLFAQPYEGVLTFAPWDDPESVTSDDQNLQRPLPS